MIRLRNFIGFTLQVLFFVVRVKSNLKCKFCKWKQRIPKNILSDAKVKLIGYTSEKKYLESFRAICFYDEEEREFTFLANAKHISALDVSNLYKKRWLVELFFEKVKTTPQDKKVLVYHRILRPAQIFVQEKTVK